MLKHSLDAGARLGEGGAGGHGQPSALVATADIVLLKATAATIMIFDLL